MKVRVITRKDILKKAGLILLAAVLIFAFIFLLKGLKNYGEKSEIRFIDRMYNFALQMALPFEIYFEQPEEEKEETLTLKDITVIDEQTQREGQITEKEEAPFIATFSNARSLKTMDDLIENLYTIESNAYVTYDDLNVDKLIDVDLSADLSVNTAEPEPKVLIFHTHSQEDFRDSRPGEAEDTIVGVGNKLAEILVNDYGVGVVHDLGQYDVLDGEVSRGMSYERMQPAILKILEKYPSIEVLLDLHRDGVPEGTHLVTEVNGRPTAKIMYFNGITRLNEEGAAVAMPELPNPYLEESLAFTLQMKLTTNETYPDFARKIYIKPYRYSLHMSDKSLLVEVGANTNTVEEAKNAMYPFAEILMKVLNK